MTTLLETNAIIRLPDEGEKHWVISDHLTFKLTGNDTAGRFTLAINRTSPQSGPPPHMHANEDEIFYVIEGEFALVLGETSFTAGPGHAVFLPRGVMHRFMNISGRPGKLLLLTNPAGFENFVAAAGYPDINGQKPGFGPAQRQRLMWAAQKHGIDVNPDYQASRPLPPPAAPRELWCIGLHLKMLLTAEQTKGSFSLVEIGLQPGNFVPLHTHEVEDEVFYVLEGTVEFEVEDEKIIAEAGTTVYVPKGTFHGFRHVGDAPARLFDLHTPGGFDQFFEATSTVCTDRAKGPPNEPIDFERFERICNQHGMVLKK